MLFGLFMVIALAGAENSLLAQAYEAFGSIESYSVTLRSEGEGGKETIKYWYKAPGFVRMEFIEPHKGAVLVYDPDKKLVRLKPFRFGFVMALQPESRLVRSKRGHTVDESDIGDLLESALRIKETGSERIIGKTEISGRSATIIRIEGQEIEGITGYDLWIDDGLKLPVKAIAYGPGNKVIEEVLMNDLKLNIVLKEDFFSID